MRFLTQNRFPRLWLLAQATIGGVPDKRRIATEWYKGEESVLEVGCSVGTVSDAFRAWPMVRFTGIDIDDKALEVARKRFVDAANFRFLNCSLHSLVTAEEQRYDYLLIAGMLHHVDDEIAVAILRDALTLLQPQGRIIISEPEALRPNDSLIFRAFYRLEEGKYLRSGDAYAALVEQAGGQIQRCERRPITPGVVPFPTVARFVLMEARPK